MKKKEKKEKKELRQGHRICAPERQAIGRLIAERRNAAGLTPGMLAAQIDLSHTAVCRIERGLYFPSERTCEGLKRVLGIDLPPVATAKGVTKMLTGMRYESLVKVYNLAKELHDNEHAVIKEERVINED